MTDLTKYIATATWLESLEVGDPKLPNALQHVFYA
jgi:hypothetical protein